TMTDFDPARIGDVKAGLAAAKADTNTRAKKSELSAAIAPLAAKDGSNVEADAFRGAIGAVSSGDLAVAVAPLVSDAELASAIAPLATNAALAATDAVAQEALTNSQFGTL